MLSQKRGRRVDELTVTLGRVVASYEVFELERVRHHRVHASAELRLDFGNTRGVPDPEHEPLVSGGESLTEVIHQLKDAGLLGELDAELGKVHTR